MNYLASASQIASNIPSANEARDIAGDALGQVVSKVNITGKDIIESLIAQLPPEVFSKISRFLDIGTYILIAIAVYLTLKIIRQILGMRDSKNLKIIANQVKEINLKLDKKK